jgi:hypothetical protein
VAKEKPFQLPTRLRITPEKQEIIAQEQELWRRQANSPFASKTPFDMERANAAVAVRDLTQNIKDVRRELRKADKKGKSDWQQTLTALKNRLAESYAVLGRYDKAARLTSNKQQRREWMDILDAIKRKDGEWCECGSQLGDLEVSNIYVKQDIYSHKHNRLMPLLACRNCGFMNVKDAPEEVVSLRNARARAVILARDRTPVEAREILTRNRHTTREILGG